MASTPYIHHGINGYSRYDTPQNVAFTATPGLLYVSRCEFLNARDVTTIQAGVVCRTEPAVVPTFTPFQVRLHRFFVPMQLYHPEMRVNAAAFDMEKLSTNVLISNLKASYSSVREFSLFENYGLLTQLSLVSGLLNTDLIPVAPPHTARTYPASTPPALGSRYVNADPLLGYWDIVRNYYSFSQSGQFHVAFRKGNCPMLSGGNVTFVNGIEGSKALKFSQFQGNLAYLDDYYEQSFYPSPGDASTYFDRNDLTVAILNSIQADLSTHGATYGAWTKDDLYSKVVNGDGDSVYSCLDIIHRAYPIAVIPAAPDRLSRALDPNSGKDVSIQNLTTVRQLAIASRMQEYSDLRIAGGTRFSDWIEVFFGASVKHVDRPLLLYSKTLYVNSQPIFNQQGSPGEGLGSFGGEMSCMDSFDRKGQRYCFDEPGYLMDLFSIRPLYYWSGVQADYATYDKMDYFNPLFNQIGYQTRPFSIFGSGTYPASTAGLSVLKEPCYNEFRSAYDYVFGDFMIPPFSNTGEYDAVRSAWVLQRSALKIPTSSGYDSVKSFMERARFVDLSTVNNPFSSSTIDNFFVNVYYNVSKRSLVSKLFATKLATR